MNQHVDGLGCSCFSIGGFYNPQVNSKNMKGAKTGTTEKIQNILELNSIGPN